MILATNFRSRDIVKPREPGNAGGTDAVVFFENHPRAVSVQTCADSGAAASELILLYMM